MHQELHQTYSLCIKLCLHNNCSCYFDANKIFVQDLPTRRLLYKGLSKNGVYPIQSQLFTSAFNKTAYTAQSFSLDKWQLWHSRLEHPSAKVLTSLFPTLHSSFLSKNVLEYCHHCLARKMNQLPFLISNKNATSLLELVCVDLWDPALVISSFYTILFLLMISLSLLGFICSNTSQTLLLSFHSLKLWLKLRFLCQLKL